MSGPLWQGPGPWVDTLPVLPRQRAFGSGTAAAAGGAAPAAPVEPVLAPEDALADRLHDVIAAAVHPDEIAAVLESDGMTDDHIRLVYGRPDSFTLAEELYARVPRAHPEPPGPPADPWRVGLLGCLLRGLVFALPGLAYVLAAPLLAGAALAPLLAGALTGWMWNQALSHRAYAWLGLGDRAAAVRCLRAGAPAGAALGTAAALLCTGAGQWPSAVFAAAQSVYLAAATPLLVLGRERPLLYCLLPLPAGTLLVLLHEDLPQWARTGLLLASLTASLTTSAASLRPTASAGRPAHGGLRRVRVAEAGGRLRPTAGASADESEAGSAGLRSGFRGLRLLVRGGPARRAGVPVADAGGRLRRASADDREVAARLRGAEPPPSGSGRPVGRVRTGAGAVLDAHAAARPAPRPRRTGRLRLRGVLRGRRGRPGPVLGAVSVSGRTGPAGRSERGPGRRRPVVVLGAVSTRDGAGADRSRLRGVLGGDPRRRAAPRLVASVPHGLFGLGVGVLVLYTALGDVLGGTTGAVVAAPSAVALTLSMGPAEWLLHRFRSETLAGLRASTTARAFWRTAAAVLAECLAGYLAVLFALALTGTLLWPGAPALGGVRLATLLLIGTVLWTGLLLQSFGAVTVAAGVCCAAALVQTAALVTGAGTPRTAGLAVAATAAAVLAGIVCALLGRATAHRV
ncbi:hypothetical protein ACF08N_13775 [Streptomyces sp. NPDC015127]|uniref:hypothetical protein n=1 Tax=Streptomyces sp. NPDC015127 TaxID=3364939 RepID=UPI0036F741A6